MTPHGSAACAGLRVVLNTGRPCSVFYEFSSTFSRCISMATRRFTGFSSDAAASSFLAINQGYPGLRCGSRGDFLQLALSLAFPHLPRLPALSIWIRLFTWWSASSLTRCAFCPSLNENKKPRR